MAHPKIVLHADGVLGGPPVMESRRNTCGRMSLPIFCLAERMWGQLVRGSSGEGDP